MLAAFRDLDRMNDEPARRGVRWLLSAQNADGGWGGAANTPSTIEETALAVEVLLSAGPEAVTAVNNGLAWLVQRIESGGLTEPTPIGFYFAKLWYFEKLYPIIFSVAALGVPAKPPPRLTAPPKRLDRGLALWPALPNPKPRRKTNAPARPTSRPCRRRAKCATACAPRRRAFGLTFDRSRQLTKPVLQQTAEDLLRRHGPWRSSISASRWFA